MAPGTMTSEELERLIALRHETRNIEFKSAGPCSKAKEHRPYLARVVQALLALSNIQDGGFVLIGVKDDGTVTGWRDGELSTWVHGHLADRVAQYVDPHVSFTLQHVVHEPTGHTVVVLTVSEFDDIPVFCRKAHPGTLEEGGLYVRPLSKVESAEVARSEDLRAIIELAVDKRLARWHRMNQLAGVAIPSTSTPDTPHDAMYMKQALGLSEGEASQVVQQARSRGHFEVVFHPVEFRAARLPTSELEPALRAAAVRLRGWEFPFFDGHTDLVRDAGFIEHRIDWERYVEAWRFYRSGLFTQVQAMESEWEERVEPLFGQPLLRGQSRLEIVDAIYTVAEMFTFAERLSRRKEFAADPHALCITARGLEDRWLYEQGDRELLRQPVEGANDDSFVWSVQVTTGELAASSRELAAQCAQGLIAMYGVELSVPQILRVQDGLFRP